MSRCSLSLHRVIHWISRYCFRQRLSDAVESLHWKTGGFPELIPVAVAGFVVIDAENASGVPALIPTTSF